MMDIPRKTRHQDHEPETVALMLLAWLANEPELIGRFLALSGLTADRIPGLAGDPAFLGGLVDFIMGNEPDLVRFAESAGLRPEAIVAAWHHFSGAGLDSGAF